VLFVIKETNVRQPFANAPMAIVLKVDVHRSSARRVDSTQTRTVSVKALLPMARMTFLGHVVPSVVMDWGRVISKTASRVVSIKNASAIFVVKESVVHRLVSVKRAMKTLIACLRLDAN